VGFRRILPGGKFRLDVFTGIDNVFDVRYSLGNDFNAAAGRYYNAAPGRNYYAGLSLNLALK
jgi:iron complex outermembrane receptor protein